MPTEDSAAAALAGAIADSEDSAYVVTSDWRLLNTSKGWRAFAERNGGGDLLKRWPVGSRIDDAFPAVLRRFYLDAYQSVLVTGEPWQHEYECSSPSEYRSFRMFVYPLTGSRLLVVNSLIVEMPHAHADPPRDDLYRVDDFLTMCANCRRTYNPRALSWDWIPSCVGRMPRRTSHGICPTCLAFYYPDAPRTTKR